MTDPEEIPGGTEVDPESIPEQPETVGGNVPEAETKTTGGRHIFVTATESLGSQDRG